MINSQNQRKVLIVGAAGFIGTNLVKALSSQHKVIAGIRYRNEKKMIFQAQRLRRIAKPAAIVAGDVREGFISPKRLRELDVDVVIYAAGQCDVDQATKEAKAGDWGSTVTMQVNAFGVQKLAKNCTALAKEGKPIQFIYLSSIYASVKGDSQNLGDEPEKHYGYSKHLGEQLLQNNPMLDISIVRLPRMVGLYQNTSAQACRIREDILFGRKLPVLNLKQMTLTPVDILNKEIQSLLEQPIIQGKFAIKELSSGSDIATSPMEIAQAFEQAIAVRFHYTPLLQTKNAQLCSLTNAIIEDRVKHFEDAAKKIQKAYREYGRRKNA
ncbi:MAG: NAD-dependent epimerase/dehydratase family protein [Candidatus Berkiella sp.]